MTFRDSCAQSFAHGLVLLALCLKKNVFTGLREKTECPDSCHVSSFDLEAMGQAYFLLIFGGVWVSWQKAVSGQWRDSVVGIGLLMPAGPCRKRTSHPSPLSVLSWLPCLGFATLPGVLYLPAG